MIEVYKQYLYIRLDMQDAYAYIYTYMNALEYIRIYTCVRVCEC